VLGWGEEDVNRDKAKRETEEAVAEGLLESPLLGWDGEEGVNEDQDEDEDVDVRGTVEVVEASVVPDIVVVVRV
jgi:hypothetical protein